MKLINITQESTYQLKATYSNLEITIDKNDIKEVIKATGIFLSPKWAEPKPNYYRANMFSKADIELSDADLFNELKNGNYYLNIIDYTDTEIHMATDFLINEWSKTIIDLLRKNEDKQITITLKNEVIQEKILEKNQHLFKTKNELLQFLNSTSLKIEDFIIPAKYDPLEIKLKEISFRLRAEQFFARRFLFTKALIKRLNDRVFNLDNEFSKAKLGKLKEWVSVLDSDINDYAKYKDFQKLYDTKTISYNIRDSKNITILGENSKNNNITQEEKSNGGRLLPIFALVVSIGILLVAIITNWGKILTFFNPQ